MKKIKLIFTSMLLAFIAVSCENDGGSSVLELTEGAVPNIRKIATTDQGLNLVALQNGEDIDLGLTFNKAFGELSSLDVVAYYTKNGATERAVLKTNITSFPAEVHINQNDLYTAFTSLNSAADFGLTDRLIITADLTLKNRSIVKLYDEKGVALYGSDIANTLDFAVVQTYTAACPLEDTSLFNGDFKITVDDWGDYPAASNIKLVYNPAVDGEFTFRILSTTNTYILNTDAYLLVTVNPANNTATITSSEDFDYGDGDLTPVTGSGTVGSCTGEVSLKIDYLGFGSNYTGFNFKLEKIN